MLQPSYERALFADLQALLAAVPHERTFAALQALLAAVLHERIAVQWDVAVEFGMLQLPEVWGSRTSTPSPAASPADSTRCRRAWPPARTCGTATPGTSTSSSPSRSRCRCG